MLVCPLLPLLRWRCTHIDSSEQRDEDGFTDSGETLPTDVSAPAQDDTGMYWISSP